jgi:hypothetical protein
MTQPSSGQHQSYFDPVALLAEDAVRCLVVCCSRGQAGAGYAPTSCALCKLGLTCRACCHHALRGVRRWCPATSTTPSKASASCWTPPARQQTWVAHRAGLWGTGRSSGWLCASLGWWWGGGHAAQHTFHTLCVPDALARRCVRDDATNHHSCARTAVWSCRCGWPARSPAATSPAWTHPRSTASGELS